MSTRVEDGDREQRAEHPADAAVELTIQPRVRSLGEFDVRRVLPAAKRRMVGPFVFLDHMGPAVFPPGHGIAVRPHPHIGLATITYLFEGEIMHRDSLGYRQLIQAGAVNLMTAGRGIVHSERASDDLAVTSRLHGIQSWIALPLELEEMEPTFLHYPATSLPERVDRRLHRARDHGQRLRPAVAGAHVFADAVSRSDAAGKAASSCCSTRRRSAPSTSSRAASRSAATLTPKARWPCCAQARPCRSGPRPRRACIVVGGAPVGPRHIWWNFVSSSEARIERAKRDWAEMRMGSVPGDDEFIPLARELTREAQTGA